MKMWISSATHGEVAEFVCSHCGNRAVAGVTGHGESDALALGRQSSAVAQQRAAAEARQDSNRLVRLVSVARCPSCGRRDKQALRRWWLWRLAPAFGIVGVAFLVGALPGILGTNLSPAKRSFISALTTWGGIGLGVFSFFVNGVWGRLSLDRGISWLEDEPPQ